MTVGNKKKSEQLPADEQKTPFAPPDRRAFERRLVELGRLLEAQHFTSMDEANAFLDELNKRGGTFDAPPPATPLEKAQDLMYDAWEAQGERRVELARKALDVCPDCADAYVLLAEETAHTTEEAYALYAKGVAAGERALGPKQFKDLTGHFWSATETRPYMRARVGLADTLWALGKHAEAIAHYQDMLRLNPNDNQGIRYLLLASLIEESRYADAEKLLARYADEPTAAWAYSRALLSFRRAPESEKARADLRAALKVNRFVPLYMFGVKKMPQALPDSIGFGDESEAIGYVADYIGGWLKTTGALAWFDNFLSTDAAALQEVQAAVLDLVSPDDMMAQLLKSWRKDLEAKSIDMDIKLQVALAKCPWQWIDGMAVHLGYSRKGKKKDKMAAIAAHLLNKDKLQAVVAGLPSQGRDALVLTLKNGWIKYGDLTRRFGTEEGDGWWWADDPPTSILGQVRLAGLLFVGTVAINGRNYRVAVVPVELRPLLAEILATPGPSRS
jgi:tetratricopeptide (TPR) repeat protein